MIFKVIAVRDRATDTFGNPFYVSALGQAIRSFSDEINRPAEDNGLNKHPDDYDLYVLGSYDSESGLFDCSTPRQIAVGKELVR
ncbi:MAG: nonstructural protein [Microvirus sp.]|nr:MAG: nonstructural protein [Microvirus sp.]